MLLNKQTLCTGLPYFNKGCSNEIQLKTFVNNCFYKIEGKSYGSYIYHLGVGLVCPEI